ncbi:alpha/beta hydrolase [Aporhodopirellula aestuarii]|uniref:Alpha/beta hydrolase n=1 Tax=Aporhodopirellula aestuarii TaxID=2950107 RepID=A0ABT0TWK9_9BACT|nr:alpha/beta hydrolase [Aporhodopirellula aestuarii]MCM2369016.1 alpha/beta hydrolase [Aporhodopirellula aestuarii]
MHCFLNRVLPVFLAAVLYSSSPLAQDSAQQATEYKTEQNVLYRSGENLGEDIQQRCRLDAYYPVNRKGFATMVWFHGGGLTGGNKSIPDGLKGQGIAVVAANYRLSPSVRSPAIIDDAAAAVAWTMKNIESRGGAPDRIFVAGHSAGGYLTSMVGLDRSYLAAHGLDPNDLAGLIPYSGHTITHFTVRKEQGIGGTQPIIDKMAPLFHVRSDAPPILLITGDRELEMLGRYEENAYFWRMLKIVGNKDVELLELDGYDHGQMATPAHPLTLKFIRKIVSTSGRDE